MALSDQEAASSPCPLPRVHSPNQALASPQRHHGEGSSCTPGKGWQRPAGMSIPVEPLAAGADLAADPRRDPAHAPSP